MNRLSIVVIAAVACLLLLVVAEPAFADCGCGPSGRPTRGTPTRLSGLGVGLAGVGLAWGVTWIGTRLAGWVSRK